MRPEFWGTLVIGVVFAAVVVLPASVLIAVPVCELSIGSSRETTNLTDRRRRRKRLVAAIILWHALPVLYPLSVGPVGYAVNRGWLPANEYRLFYGPMWQTATFPPFRRIAQWTRLEDYYQYCLLMGRRHAQAE